MQEETRKINIRALTIVVLLFINLWIWVSIGSFGAFKHPEIYFLDVGQGDAQLAVLPKSGGGVVKILNDAGTGSQVVGKISEALGPYDNKYIDLLIMSHAHFDHYGGFKNVLEYYDVGAFIYNGLDADDNEGELFFEIKRTLEEKEIPIIVLGEKDKIKYLDNEIEILSPDESFLNFNNLDEASIVFVLEANGRKVLFTGDAGFVVEDALIEKGYDLSADVFKVGHHGSRFSTGANFVSAVSPAISVIGVGKNNYGHPAPPILELLELAGSRTYKTKEHGTVKIILD